MKRVSVPVIRRPPTLRRALIAIAALFGLVTMAAMIGVMYTSQATSRALAENAREAAAEDRIADRLIEAAHAQQLAAVHYAQFPSEATLERFRASGRDAFEAVRLYLFLPLPLSARRQVEAIKEAHERFEVVTLRALSTSERMTPEDREAIVAAASRFSSEVNDFTDARALQHSAQSFLHEQRLARHRGTTIALGFLVLALALLAAFAMRRVVLRPLADFERAARTLGAGDDTARVPAQRFEEFDVVAASFNRTAENLRVAQRDLVQHEKLSAMGEMLASLAHEINNPLAAILANAEVLEMELDDGTGDPEKRRLLELTSPVVIEARRVRDIVRSLLNLSHRSEGGLASVDLAATVRDARSLRERSFVKRGLRLVTDVPEGLAVLADRTRLQASIVNLLTNALDAVSEKGSETRIEARRADDGMIELAVSDDGPGFVEPERAFEPFYTTKPMGKGTGLGLPLVHRFVRDAGGTMTAENAPGGGAVIRIRLHPPTPDAPMTRVVERTPLSVAAINRRDSEGASARDGALSGAMSAQAADDRPTVLVVDDEDAMRRVQEWLLVKLGADVVMAENGADAQKVMSGRRIDLVISDLRMPGDVDGFELIRWMKKTKPALAASAFVMTGDAYTTGLEELGIPEGRILAKPFEITDFIERVGAALKPRR